VETGVASMGGDIKVSSNYLIISLSLKFSSSMSIMKTSSASPVTLWIKDNFDGHISLRSMVDRDIFLFFKVLSKINFLEDLSNNAFFTKKVSSSKKIPS
jgi:hypothetical protein